MYKHHRHGREPRWSGYKTKGTYTDLTKEEERLIKHTHAKNNSSRRRDNILVSSWRKEKHQWEEKVKATPILKAAYEHEKTVRKMKKWQAAARAKEIHANCCQAELEIESMKREEAEERAENEKRDRDHYKKVSAKLHEHAKDANEKLHIYRSRVTNVLRAAKAFAEHHRGTETTRLLQWLEALGHRHPDQVALDSLVKATSMLRRMETRV